MFRLIVTKRADAGFLEKAFISFSKPLQFVAPKLMHTPVQLMAKAMLANTFLSFEGEKSPQIVDNYRMYELEKLYDESIKQ